MASTHETHPATGAVTASVDGVSGEYRPPVELDIPRVRATRGMDGLASGEAMSHHEHLEAVRQGRLGSVHSWELVTGVDGPGTRMTVFMAGCELRCQYCHNPDTWFTAKGTPVMLDDLDLVLLDIKSGDPETYRRVTGQELEATLRFARRLAERGVETWVRYVWCRG